MRAVIVGGVALATLAVAGCVPKKKYDALQNQYEQLNLRYASLQSESEGLRVTVHDLEEQIEILEDSNVYLASFYTDLLNEFRPLLDTDEARIVVYPDRTSLALSEDFLFASGSSELTRDGADVIGHMAEIIRRHPGRRFSVEGHTDDVPIRPHQRFDTNWDLGAERAVAVVEQLVAVGVPPDQLSAASYADTEPLDTNGSDLGREQNRRVEISFQPTLDELPGHDALLQQGAEVIHAQGAEQRTEPERTAPSTDILEL